MTNPEHKVADAIREVTVAIQTAIPDGYRYRMIDADGLIEMLLSIADRLDPPVAESVAPEFACSDCGERNPDQLVWITDELPRADMLVRYDICGMIFDFMEEGP